MQWNLGKWKNNDCNDQNNIPRETEKEECDEVESVTAEDNLFNQMNCQP